MSTLSSPNAQVERMIMERSGTGSTSQPSYSPASMIDAIMAASPGFANADHRAGECIAMLDAVGMGGEGHPNSLVAMTAQACRELLRLRQENGEIEVSE